MAIQNDLTTRRVPVMGSVHLEPAGSFPSRVLSMLDLGSGGFFVHTAFPLPVGTRISCSFHLGDEPAPLQVQAEVAWIRPGPENMNPPPGMGLRFVRLGHAAHERILRVIEAHNEHIQYFLQHQELPEDAMRWKIPRVQLEIGDDGIPARIEAWNGLFQVLTMALPFQPGQDVSSRTPDGAVEHGRIAWMQFVLDGPQGAEMKLGIELQMHSWGQETVLRRPTSEIMAPEAGDAEWEYEIIQSVPASMTIAPTLPLHEANREPSAASSPAFFPQAPETVTAPALPAAPIKPPAPPAAPAAPVRPEPRMEPAAVRFPAPKLPSDTYPVATGSSIPGKWPLTGRATAWMLAALFLIAAILLMTHPDSPIQPKRHLSGTSHLRGTGDLRQFLAAKNPEYTITRGKSIASSPAFLPSANPPASPQPAADPIPERSTAATSNANPNPSPEKNGTPHFGNAASSLEITSRPHDATIAIPGEGGRYQHYFLANPAGVVLDIEEASLLVAGGIHPGDTRHIRKIKVVPMNRKTRIIVYTRTLPGKVDVVPQNGLLQLRLHFDGQIAKR